jgi:Fic family protein
MKKLIAIFFIIFSFSCSNIKKSSRPENLFSKDKMADLLTDLYVIEGAISSNRNAYTQSGVLPSSYIYEKYDMDSLTFKENFNYYTDRVEDYLSIINQVQDNLKSLQDSVSLRQEKINDKKQNRILKGSLKNKNKNLEKPDPEEEY